MGAADDDLSADDRDALGRLVIEMAWRVDHGQAESVHELFTDDGTLALGGETHIGRDAILRWGVERSRSARVTRHVCTNMRFVRTGPGRARGSTLLTVYLHDGEGSVSAVPFAVAEYRDEFVLADGRWRFSSRVTEPIFTSSRS